MTSDSQREKDFVSLLMLAFNDGAAEKVTSVTESTLSKRLKGFCYHSKEARTYCESLSSGKPSRYKKVDKMPYSKPSSSRFDFRLLALLLLLMVCNIHGLLFRSATPDDIAFAQKILLKEKMNPFGVSQETLLVAVRDDEDDKNGSLSPVLGFGQIRPLNDEYAELASLYVIPENRNQGIGGALVQNLLERHDEKKSKQRICLLTLKPTTPFYEPYGFRVATDNERKELPSSIQLEYQAGLALSFLLGNDLVCMVHS